MAVGNYYMDEQAIIIGWGVVGKATGYALGINNWLDKDTQYCKYDFNKVEYYIICVPTPTIKGKQDISTIEEWLEKIKEDPNKEEKTVIIRSTILPGTTEKLEKKYGLKIAFVPEFLTEATALEDAKNPEFLVVGANEIFLRENVKNLFNDKLKLPKDRIIACSSTTAEMIKYTINSFFTMKVIFGNQLWDVARECGANYEELRYALETHKWGSKNGWSVWHKGKRGAGGKCLRKDLQALIGKFNMPLLETVNKINERLLSETSK